MKVFWTFAVLCSLVFVPLEMSTVAAAQAITDTIEESGSGPADDLFVNLPSLVPGSDLYANDPELSESLRILLQENPDILAARRAWLSSLERPSQVRSLPDPTVGVRYFVDNVETRVGPMEAGLELAQRVPWPSKLSTDGRRAERLAATLKETVREVERDRARSFKRSYYDLAYVEEALTINEEEQQLLHRFEQIALTRYSTGAGIQHYVIKVQTEITRLIDQATSLRERRDILSRRLAQLLGRPESSPTMKHPDLVDPALVYDRHFLEMEALDSRPALEAIREQIHADEILVQRRRLDSRPDFSFGLAYTAVGRREDPTGRSSPPPDNGDDALAFVAGVTIPLHSGRISSGIREAHEALNSNLLRLQSREDQVRYEVQEASLKVDSLLERTELYRNNLIPQAEQSLSSSEAAYETNQLDFLDLIDAERVLFQVRLTYRRLLSDVWMALADLERAVGVKFPTEEMMLGRGENGNE